MTFFAKLLLPLALMACSSAALADPWKDESGKGRRGEHKEEYWDGHCKVERKWKKNGDFKEERKCKAPKHHVRRDDDRHDRHYQPVIVQEPVYYPPQEAPRRGEPGIEIDVRIRP